MSILLPLFTVVTCGEIAWFYPQFTLMTIVVFAMLWVFRRGVL